MKAKSLLIELHKYLTKVDRAYGHHCPHPTSKRTYTNGPSDLSTLFCKSDPGTVQVWLQRFHGYLELKKVKERRQTWNIFCWS